MNTKVYDNMHFFILKNYQYKQKVVAYIVLFQQHKPPLYS